MGVLLLCLSAAYHAKAQDTLARKPLPVISIPAYHPSTQVLMQPALPANLSTRNYGFFCRQELKLERRNIPLRFRLGSLEQCNYLEQKPGYTAPPQSR